MFYDMSSFEVINLSDWAVFSPMNEQQNLSQCLQLIVEFDEDNIAAWLYINFWSGPEEVL